MDESSKGILNSARIEKLGALFLLVASVFVATLAVSVIQNVFDSDRQIQNVISVSGEGTVLAVPDIARISFSVSEQADDANTAQDTAAERINDALAVLDEFDIDEKDIKTTSYNLSPQYNRRQPCFDGFCPEYVQEIIGYTVSQTVEVKVRDTDEAGAILSRLGDTGVSNIYGPNFTIDDPDALQEEARSLAIKDAREKADQLVKDLGVRIVRVVSFNDGGGYYPYERSFDFGGDTAVFESAAVPELPVGENEVTVNVTITYEIR